MKGRLFIFSLLLLIGLSVPLLAVRLASSTSAPVGVPKDPHLDIVPPSPPDAIRWLLQHQEVGEPQHHENLVLYPVYPKEASRIGSYLLLDAAMDDGAVVVREMSDADVNRARVRNNGKQPVFAMGGEMLRGAKQDRIIGADLILPPKTELIVPIYCVEHGRWVEESTEFKSSHYLAPKSVRVARAKADQSAVWDSVAGEQEAFAAPSVTGSLSSVQESAGVQRKAAPYVHTLKALPEAFPKAIGVVAVVGDEIIAADLFGSRELFTKLWPKLLDSYVLDAIDRVSEGKAPRADAIHQWLARAAEATRTEQDTPGTGHLFKLHGHSLTGSALVDGGVVHLELFPGAGVPEDDFNTLQFRRDRLQEDR